LFVRKFQLSDSSYPASFFTQDATASCDCFGTVTDTRHKVSAIASTAKQMSFCRRSLTRWWPALTRDY